jgi:hypothetical protein
MLKRYKCRAECFSDVCNFYNSIVDMNSKKDEKKHIKICNVTIQSDIFSTLFEFDSNINYMKIRKLMYNCNTDFHIMYETLLPIKKYTGIRDDEFMINEL